MNINKKIIGLLVVSFFLVSSLFTINSVRALKKNQGDNLRLFKEEFLELGRELFESNSNLFFTNLESELALENNGKVDKETIFNFINKVDPNRESVVVVDLETKKFLDAYSDSNIISIFDKQTMDELLEGYIQENTLSRKTSFDLDNFDEFGADSSNQIIPKKIHFHTYNDAGIMVGFGQDFLNGKIRIKFIERQNQILFDKQLYSSLIIFAVILILTTLSMIIFMRQIILNPLSNIITVVKDISAGDLTKQVKVISHDEIGDLGLAFNEMTSKLKNSYDILESKIEERTKELQSERGSLEKKVEERTAELEKLKNDLEKTIADRTQTLNNKVMELEKMNTLMVGREIKMLELKKEIDVLKKSNK